MVALLPELSAVPMPKLARKNTSQFRICNACGVVRSNLKADPRRSGRDGPLVLVLAPTRELVVQVTT
jgi:hypothetical protein